MPKTLVAFLILVNLLSPALAQTPDPKRWEKTIAAFETQDNKTPPPKDAILFTGSSSIALWTDLPKAFPDLPVINRGFGGSTTPEVNFYVDRIVLPYKPRLVVLFSGTNDLANKRTPEQVFADFQTFVKKVQDPLPATKIGYISIHTAPGRTNLREANLRVNKLVADECAKSPNLFFMDIHDLMQTKDSQPNPDLYKDALHPNAKGYELWKQRLTPILREKYGIRKAD